jgi:hypothetical protein
LADSHNVQHAPRRKEELARRRAGAHGIFLLCLAKLNPIVRFGASYNKEQL